MEDGTEIKKIQSLCGTTNKTHLENGRANSAITVWPEPAFSMFLAWRNHSSYSLLITNDLHQIIENRTKSLE